MEGHYTQVPRRNEDERNRDFSPINRTSRLELTIMKPLIFLNVALCAGLTTLCDAQEGIKIVSRWSTNWDVGSSLTYVLGDHERTEEYWGVRTVDAASRMSSLSLEECGAAPTFYIVRGKTLYGANPETQTPPPPTSALGPGIIRVQVVHVDTGERKVKFGLMARHIITTEKYDFTNSTCQPDETSHKYDGWYSDWPYSNKCSKLDTPEAEPTFRCGDRVVVTREGPRPSGFVMSMDEEVGYPNWRTVYSSSVVQWIERQSLDPALFERPANVRPTSELGKRPPKSEDQPSNPPN